MKYNAIKILKIIFVPAFLTLLISFVTAIALERTATKSYQTLYIDNNVAVNNMQVNEIMEDINYRKEAIIKLELNMEHIARSIISSRGLINDTYLEQIAEINDLTSIVWFDQNGLIISSSVRSQTPVNYVPVPGDPIYLFLESGEPFLFEVDRLSTSTDKNYYFYYLKDLSDNYFLQVTILSDKLKELSLASQLKNIVEKIEKKSNSVISVAVLDANLNVVESSENANMNRLQSDLDYYYDIFSNKKSDSRIRYSYNYQQDILEIISTIEEEGEVIYLISTLYTLTPYLQVIKQIRLIVIILTLVINASAFILIYIYVIRPLKVLVESISSFDPLTAKYQTPERNYFFYEEAFIALDSLSNHIKVSNTEREKLHQRLYEQSITDYLTKLPNRRHLIRYIEEKISSNKMFALIFVDIDNFKKVNDSKGHIIGDAVLRETSKRLLNYSSQEHFVARYGGDEFIVITEFVNKKMLSKQINKLYKEFHDPIFVNDENISVYLSLGISLFPNEGSDANELIRKADLAIYEAKAQGKNKHAYYDVSMDLNLKEEIRIKEIIEDAIINDGFKIVLQPQVNIYTNEIISYESLARIKNQTVGPYQFIPIAEKYDLIDELGRIIVGKTIKALLKMRDEGLELKTIYVNFSANQLKRYHIPDDMNLRMKEEGLDNQYIGIEITESVLLEKEDYVVEFFEKLKGFGFKLAIDDFGSGSAGINYLTDYPLGLVKLDKSFADLYLNKEKVDIYESVIILAKKLGYNVLAEGIETSDQIDLLKEIDCMVVQGYYYYRPMELEEIIALAKKDINQVK